MYTPATDSAFDVAYWFLNKAEQNRLYIEDAKLQHLLFLAQVRYAMQYNMEQLLPSLFMVDENGFFEPNISRIFAMGRPFMPIVKLSEKVEIFLNDIWDKYGKMSERQLTSLIKNSSAYKDNYIADGKNLVELKTVIEKLKSSENLSKNYITDSQNKKKVLISQNGPVVVSKWKPRKITS